MVVPVVIEVDNVRCRIRSAPDIAIWRLHERLAYPRDVQTALGGLGDEPDVPDDQTFTWDGWKRFLRRPKPRLDGTCAPPWFETGLLGRAMAILWELGLSVQICDFRARPRLEQDVPRFWPKESLLPYQERAVEQAIKVGQGVIVAPPRAGKTRILLELFRRLGLPTLLVAPTTSIVDQTAIAARAYGYAACDVLVLRGKVNWEEARHAQLWLCTAAKAISLSPEVAAMREVVAADELHHYTKSGAWGQRLHELFPHVFHWYGASGTYRRSGGDGMALEAFLSGVVFEISSRELIQLGRLVPTRLAFLPFDGKVPRGTDPRREGLLLSPERNALVAAVALHLAQRDRRVLIMVAYKQQGQQIAELINQNAPWSKRGEWRFGEFLFRGRGGSQVEADLAFRRRLTGAFLEGRGPAVLLGTSLIGEGVDLPDADAVIWARGESAAVSYLQGLYRVCTAAPGKTEALAVDFADRQHPRLLEASRERLAIAYQDPTFEVQVLQHPEELAAWAQ